MNEEQFIAKLNERGYLVVAIHYGFDDGEEVDPTWIEVHAVRLKDTVSITHGTSTGKFETLLRRFPDNAWLKVKKS